MSNVPKFACSKTVRIVIVDDHPLIREGLKARIETEQDLEVCGEANSVAEGLAQVTATQPELVIIDIQLVDSHGLDLVSEIHRRFPNVKMLVVSAYEESLYADRALRAGADGYINKRELQDIILVAIRKVISGRRYLSPAMTEHMVDLAITGRRPPSEDPIASLSDRELEVFELIGHGKSTSSIAGQLFLSTHTIDTYRGKLRQKLRLKNGTELMQRAVQWVLEHG